MRIGLEIHAQIMTSSKLFSPASVGTPQSKPNSCVSLFDAAAPGNESYRYIIAILIDYDRNSAVSK